MTLKSLIYYNFWLKLFSVVLATLIWFAVRVGIENNVTSGQNPIANTLVQESFTVPVRILQHAADTRVYRLEHDQVQISVTGDAAVLRATQKKEYKAYIDLTELKQPEVGTNAVIVDVPARVQFKSVFPQSLKIELVSP